MANTSKVMNCPHCHTRTSITPLNTIYGQASMVSDPRGVRWFIGSCNLCSNPVLVGEVNGVIWPHPLPTQTAAEIPEAIRGNLDEAKMCNSVSAWRASVTMCRRAIQMACIDKGASPADNLVSQINSLKSSGIITQDIHEWATVVRWVGNDGAHPGGNEPDAEDAASMLDLAEQFLHVLYVAPAKAAAHRAKLGR